MTRRRPQVLAFLRSLAINLMRLKDANKIKETMQWVHGNRAQTISFMTAQRRNDDYEE